MSLREQQELIIKLHLEKKFRKRFLESQTFRDQYYRYYNFTDSDRDVIAKLDFARLRYQSDLIRDLLFRDYQTNIPHVFAYHSTMKQEYYRYADSYPYRLVNKFEEYIRFLNFVLANIQENSSSTLDSKWIVVQDVIRHSLGLLHSSKKREESIFVFNDSLFFDSGAPKEMIICNPSLCVQNISTSIGVLLDSFDNETQILESDYSNNNVIYFYMINEDTATVIDVDDQLIAICEFFAVPKSSALSRDTDFLKNFKDDDHARETLHDMIDMQILLRV